MITPLVYLCIQTIILWILVVFLHRQKNRYTLIPLYAYIAVLTLFTHNFSDLGFAIVVQNWFFLIASFSFFTTLMLGVLFLYLFEGPRATRLALLIILFTSFLYIAIVGTLNMQVDASHWILLTRERLVYYFWSILAIIVDVFFIPISWEVLKKIRKIPFAIRIFLVVLGTYLLDSVIFVSGVFGGQQVYTSMLQGSILIRLPLAVIITPIILFFLKTEGFIETMGNGRQNVWEILNFRSDLEVKIQTLEDAVKQAKDLEMQLTESKEKYALAIEGANAGIWDWNVITDVIMFSPQFCHLIGYEAGEIEGTLAAFKKILHPEDIKKTFDLVDECFRTKEPFSIEYRIKTKKGEYKWYLCGGIVKYDESGKPTRMVGSIIDINEKRELLESYKEKVHELEQLNSLMVGRELEMVKLKEELGALQKR